MKRSFTSVGLQHQNEILKYYYSVKIYNYVWYCIFIIMDIRIIIRIHNLVNIQQTGSPKSLAENLQLSERMVYHYLNYMKSEMNAPIKYNFKKQSYCYTEEVQFCFIREKLIINNI